MAPRERTEEQRARKRELDRERARNNRELARARIDEEKLAQKRKRDRERAKAQRDLARATRTNEEQRASKAKKKVDEEKLAQKRERDRERAKAQRDLARATRTNEEQRASAAKKKLDGEKLAQKRKQDRERARARRAEAAARRTPEREAAAAVHRDDDDDDRAVEPVPLMWSRADDRLVLDVESDAESDLLRDDYDIGSEEEDSDDIVHQREPAKPNDPNTVAKVCVEVERALAGVCAARCFVCDRLLNERARQRVNFAKLKEEDRQAVSELLDRIVTVPGKYDMCSTCRKYVIKKAVPPSAAVNGFRYPPMPPGLRPLTEVEEHVLALRLPFMQIMHLGNMGTRGQYGVRGSVINVPNDAQDTLRTVIPLLPEEDKICVANLKRKLMHRRAYARSFIRRDNLVQWCRFLQNSTLYRQNKVIFDETRLQASDTEQPTEPTSNEEGDMFFHLPDEPANHEEMFQRYGSIQHTLLMENRIPAPIPAPAPAPGPSRANPDTDEVDIAPGEHQKPISVVWDRKAEELSFPGIYLGEPRTFPHHVTRYRAMHSEVLRFDRRGARPLAVLYKYLVHVRDQASGRTRHMFKRGAKKTLGATITKEQLLDENFVARAQKKGLAVPCLLPNDSEYWRIRSHDLFAMVRQLGRPHLFLTLSFSESNCKPLMHVLRKLHEQHGEMDRDSAANIDANQPLPAAVSPEAMEVIDDVIQREDRGEDLEMTSEEKLRLIREDPIVCAMMFREIVLQLKRFLRMRSNGPMGQHYVKDWFIRIEFQQRGAPHAHTLLWLNDGPTQPLDDIEGAIRFADALLSCDSSHPLAVRNSHNHTTTCFRKKTIQRRFRNKQLDPREAHRHCRFDAPFWPTPRTRILFPLYANKDERPEEHRDGRSWEEYIEYLREMRLRLKDVLSSESCPDTLEAVWREAGCPDDATYELAIRTGLKHAKILYRRKVQDRWTNSYVPWVLDAFGFNTDGQLILDVYSLVRYCVSYVTKAEKNHSQLHNEITNLRREQAFDDRTLMKMIASRTLRAKETSAQEASWVLLNFPLSEMSRKCTFVDTSLPDERNHCPKPKKDICALPDGSTDLWYPDVFDIYSKRREELQDVTLAEFVAAYHQSTNNNPRKRDRIVRYRRFDEHSDDKDQRENFYRAMCTLHIPWRNEAQDILSAGTEENGFQTLYYQHEGSILEKRRRFEAMLGLETDMEEELDVVVAEEEADANEAADGARFQLAGDCKFVFEDAEFMDVGAQDIDIDMPEPRFNQPRSDPVAKVRRRGVWDRDKYLQIMRCLNSKQREVVFAVYDGVRLQREPLLLYIDGAAGTGKSLVAQCCANAFDTYSAPGTNSDDSRVLVCAPTGKAASVIGGVTIHHAYQLSLNQEAGASERLRAGSDTVQRPAQGSKLANLQNFFENIEAQLIDEISMVSARNFVAIDQRCKEAKGNEKDFGGLYTIVLGDFNQLPPTGGKPVYARSTEELAGSAALWQKFQYVELTENMRQGEDKRYAEVLSVIGNAEKALSDEDCDLIESRFVAENNLDVPSDVPRLYHHNKDKDNHNKRMLLRAPNRSIMRLYARDRLQVKPTFQGCLAGRRGKRQERAESILDRAKELSVAKSQGLPYELLAVVGRPYKLTFNMDTTDKLVNGAVGTLVWVQLGVLSAACRPPGEAGPALAVEKLWLRFPGDSGAQASRAAAAELQLAIQRQRNIPAELIDALPFDLPPYPNGDEQQGLVPIERRDLPLIQLRMEAWRQVLRHQFPLTPAFADTIHSSQGSSYDAACVEYYEGMTNEMVYVALSRVRSLRGLFINYSGKKNRLHRTTGGRVTKRPATRARLFVHPKIRAPDCPLKREKERLRARSFKPRWAGLLQRPASSLRLVCHNVQSLRAHHTDISIDREVFMPSDILVLTETWLQPKDSTDLGNGMNEVARCDKLSTTQEHEAGGVAVFSRLPLTQRATLNTLPGIEAVSAGSEHLLVIGMYCHPSARLQDILCAVDIMLPVEPLPRTTILCGDFNKDFHTPAGQRIVQAVAARGLTMTSNLAEPTTYAPCSTIDAAFSNVAGTKVGTYQSYFSYHMPLVIDVPL